MIDTPDMFSVDISIKKNSDGKKYSKDDIISLLNESKNLVQKNFGQRKQSNSKNSDIGANKFFLIWLAHPSVNTENWSRLDIHYFKICNTNFPPQKIEFSFINIFLNKILSERDTKKYFFKNIFFHKILFCKKIFYWLFFYKYIF